MPRTEPGPLPWDVGPVLERQRLRQETAVASLTLYAATLGDPPERQYISDAVAHVRSHSRMELAGAVDIVRVMLDLGWRPTVARRADAAWRNEVSR